MTKPTCSIEDCDRPSVARGWCSKHWQRWQRHGDPLIVHPPKGPDPVDPWTRIDVRGPDECWPWTHRTDADGYGLQKIAGIGWRVARWVLTQKIGRDMLPTEVTRHTCDNPPCCNPAHLIAGEAVDNTRDMLTRGRHIHGEAHWAKRNSTKVQGMNNGEAKLTDADVIQIRQRYATGMERQVDLADEFGVAQTRISSIVLRKTWKHVA